MKNPNPQFTVQFFSVLCSKKETCKWALCFHIQIHFLKPCEWNSKSTAYLENCCCKPRIWALLRSDSSVTSRNLFSLSSLKCLSSSNSCISFSRFKKNTRKISAVEILNVCDFGLFWKSMIIFIRLKFVDLNISYKIIFIEIPCIIQDYPYTKSHFISSYTILQGFPF